MTTINSPTTHGQTESITGQSYQFLEPGIRQELAENFDPVAAMFVRGPTIDFARTGTDTSRMDRFGGVGWAKEMDSVSGETDPGSLSSWTAAYDSITIGRQHLAYSESFQYAATNARAPSIEDVPAWVAASYLKTLRNSICTLGATFTTNVADANSTCDVDDIIALVNAASATDGFTGEIDLMHKNRQIGYLRSSIRSETALKFPEPFAAFMKPIGAAGLQFVFAGVRVWSSNDVDTASGDDFGFWWTPDTFVRAILSTGNLGDISDANPIYLPEYGLIGTRSTSGVTTVKRHDFNCWSGIAARDTSLAPHGLFRNDDGV
jgi:hypothetical protein